MGIVTIMIFLLFRKKYSLSGAGALGVSVFISLFILYTAVLMRYFGIMPHKFGVSYDVGFDRLFNGSRQVQVGTLCNIAVFIPFGFFGAEFLVSTKRFGGWRRIGLATLAGFALSLCIEILQLVLRVGFFEVTDLVMNTVGAFVGASLSAVGRKVLGLFPQR